MADLGNFSGAVLADSKIAIGKRPPIIPQTSFLMSAPTRGNLAVRNQPYRMVSGIVQEKGVNVSRTVFAFGEDEIPLNQLFLLGKTVSNPTTGAYSINLGTYTGKVSIVALDGTLNSKLTSAIDNMTTTITLDNPSVTNLNGLNIVIDNEIMLVISGGATTTLTVSRAVKGTVAASHSNNTAVTKLNLNSRIFSGLTFTEYTS